MIVCNLASGSRGNSSFLEADDTKVLVDCGLSLKEMENRLKLIGKNPNEIKAIFLTHEHRDHMSGLVAFCYKYGTLAFIHQRVILRYGYMFEKIKDKIRVFDNSDFYFGSLTVSPFMLSHDSISCVGFSFYNLGKKVCFATDTGFMPIAALEAMKGASLVFIESNHDKRMLVYGTYNARLKRRIASEEGHLSNSQCANVVVALAKCGTQNFVLSHLSQENNEPQVALSEVKNRLEENGLIAVLDVASQSKPTKIYSL